jgi:hypothetical protein
MYKAIIPRLFFATTRQRHSFPKQLPPTEAITNVNKLTIQPELVRYYHAPVGFPTKPTWVAAIKNRQFALRPGLTAKAVTKHFLELEETAKGHDHKTGSGLYSTKTTASDDMYSDNHDNDTAPKPHPPPYPTTKQCKVYIKIYDLKDKAQLKMYSNQTRKFPKKSSRSNQYIMVVIKLDSNAILVEAMKTCMAGKMIHIY